MLEIALGDYPHTRELKSRLAGSPLFNFVNVQPITKAFAPMARQQAYDISEMALVTFLQAKAYGKPLVLLPFAVAARSQEISLICLANNDAIRGPADLVGKRVGVRAYSQTTGAWIRGILADEFGIRPEDIHWVTFEDAHVAEYKDPPFAERAKPGSDMMAMLRAGELDAVIVGNDKPVNADLKDVYPDAEAAGRQFKAEARLRAGESYRRRSSVHAGCGAGSGDVVLPRRRTSLERASERQRPAAGPRGDRAQRRTGIAIHRGAENAAESDDAIRGLERCSRRALIDEFRERRCDPCHLGFVACDLALLRLSAWRLLARQCHRPDRCRRRRRPGRMSSR